MSFERIIVLQLGEDNEKTKESSELLKHLTSQAVALQRKINEFSKSSSASFANAALPALFITQPTHKGVLEMLNVINGFFFFHLKLAPYRVTISENIKTFRNPFHSPYKSFKFIRLCKSMNVCVCLCVISRIINCS